MSDDAVRVRFAEELRAAKAALDDARKAKAAASREGAETGTARANVEALEFRVFEAERAHRIAERNGGELGVAIMGSEIVGLVAIRLAPGTGSDARAHAIDDVLATDLDDCARELGGVLAASPNRYARERPGRDAEGRTVLEVRGRLEGDRVVPAIAPKRR